jgi:hypothetical protein
MKAIQMKQFPGALSGAKTWLAIQQLWERQPELRPQILGALKSFYLTVNTVVAVRS